MNRREPEPGRCACCSAADRPLFTWDPTEILGHDWRIQVCQECKDDGTFLEWMTAHLEEAAKEMGMKPVGVVIRNGKERTLWQ